MGRIIDRLSVEAALSWPFSKTKDTGTEWLHQSLLEQSEKSPKNFKDKCKKIFRNLKTKFKKNRNTIATQTEPTTIRHVLEDFMGSNYVTEITR